MAEVLIILNLAFGPVYQLLFVVRVGIKFHVQITPLLILADKGWLLTLACSLSQESRWGRIKNSPLTAGGQEAKGSWT